MILHFKNESKNMIEYFMLLKSKFPWHEKNGGNKDSVGVIYDG